MKPTIAHIITGLNTGGAEIMLERLLTRHDRSAFRPVVICLTNPGPTADRIRELGIPVINVDVPRGIPNPLAIAKIRSLLKRENAIVAQTWLYHADLLGGTAARLSGIPVAWGVHRSSLDPSNTKRSVRVVAYACRLVARFVPTCIVCCAESTLDFHTSFGYPSRKMVEIPNGFDLTVFKPDPAARLKTRQQLNIRDDEVLIGIVGRFMAVKNHTLFVDAAAQATTQHPDLRFVMIGDGLDQNNTELVSWLRAAPQPARFTLLGRRSDTPELIAGMDIMSLSSASEAFPLVIGEAMATAVPCVATNVGDTARLIGDTGEVVPPGDVDALADAMILMANRTPQEREQLGARARSRIGSMFDIEMIFERYEHFWQQLAAGETPCG